MRHIEYRVVHCTATDPTATVDAIKKYWREEKGWKTVGYHVIITANGDKIRLAEDHEVTNGVYGYNSSCLHVCYVGGVDEKGNAKDTRTPQQKQAIGEILQAWKKLYPKSIALGHRDFINVKKACPSFEVKNEYD